VLMNSWFKVGSGSSGFETWGLKGYVFHTLLIFLKGVFINFFVPCIQYIIYNIQLHVICDTD